MTYVPLCLTLFRALRALLTCLIYGPGASFSLALHALFVCLKIFLGWICSSSKTLLFTRTIKGTENALFYIGQKRVIS